MNSGSSIVVRFEALEIARGHDGLLRGKPEPVVALGVYTYGEDGAALATRQLIRVRCPPRLPGAFVPSHTIRLHATSRVADEGFLVFAIALEEDAGSDVTRSFGALERPERFTAWREEDSPALATSLQHVAGLRPGVASPVRLLLDDQPADAMRADEWVGASLARFSRGVRHASHVRMSFLSGDKYNDWTARLRVLVRTGRLDD
ncbi:MAG: hypothetical protein HOW73_33410 [Polyangiaceae bacterium]|nr:hypothetical protein [Polyangiaceae bacterium]